MELELELLNTDIMFYLEEINIASQVGYDE